MSESIQPIVSIGDKISLDWSITTTTTTTTDEKEEIKHVNKANDGANTSNLGKKIAYILYIYAYSFYKVRRIGFSRDHLYYCSKLILKQYECFIFYFNYLLFSYT